MQKLTAVIHKEGKFYVAQCPELATVSQGESKQEALKNLQEATELYLEEYPEKVPFKTFVTTFTMRHA
tara:strand:- start:269 stop:472 length:204 start_codon:yes stop_codon:yes gene_type:complete